MERVFPKLEQMGIPPVRSSNESIDRPVRDAVTAEVVRRATELRAIWQSEESDVLAMSTE